MVSIATCLQPIQEALIVPEKAKDKETRRNISEEIVCFEQRGVLAERPVSEAPIVQSHVESKKPKSVEKLDVAGREELLTQLCLLEDLEFIESKDEAPKGRWRCCIAWLRHFENCLMLAAGVLCLPLCVLLAQKGIIKLLTMIAASLHARTVFSIFT